MLATTSVGTLLAEAERSRPEIRRATTAQQAADADRTGSRASLLPQVAVQAAFDVSGTQFNDRSSAWLAGAAVRWNLSLGGAERAQVQAATQRARAPRPRPKRRVPPFRSKS